MPNLIVRTNVHSYERTTFFLTYERTPDIIGGMTDTPVGERPSGGGRVRQYATDAERARAWRERQRERRPPTAEAVPALLAEATLATVVDRLGELIAGHRSGVEELVSRAEEAIAVLVDPEAVAGELEAVRAETAREVATAQERIVRAGQERGAAETRAVEAENAANQAWERVEALEAELAALRLVEADLRAAVEQGASDAAEALAVAQTGYQAQRDEHEAVHRQAFERVRAEADAERASLIGAHAAELRDVQERAGAELAAERAAHIEALAAAHAEREEARGRADVSERAAARAEGTASVLEAEVAAARSELDATRAEIPRVVATATESAAALHAAEFATLRATLEGQVAKLTAEADAARAQAVAVRELADTYRAQLERPAQGP